MTAAEPPLMGYRVLDLSNVLAGPFCAHQLVHLGAEVIKVEVPGAGDLARNLGADPARSARGMGISFLAQNAGKKSITLNLKQANQREAFLRLVATSHVVLENFRPGVMDRLGLGFNALLEHRVDLIYCAISGYGQTGPLRHAPAYDQIIQGMSGAMDITGTAESGPLRAGFPIADTVGGLTAAIAICACLAQKTPQARYIDVSMVEALLTTMGWAVSNFLIGGVEAARLGNENMTAAPSGTFRTGEGLINIAANKQEQWETLADLIAAPGLKTDSRFLSREDRKTNRHALTQEIESHLKNASAEIWSRELNAAGVPTGLVLSLKDALSQEQISERGLVSQVQTGDETLHVLGIAPLIDKTRMQPEAPPPRLGQDQQEVLGPLGYTDADFKAWEDET